VTALDTAKQIQALCGLSGADVDGLLLGKSLAAFDALRDLALSEYRAAHAAPEPQPLPGGLLIGDGTWPFHARIAGDDIVCENIVITCFGGAFDPQDSGATASGISTRKNPDIHGVSIAMDGRQFRGLSAGEHRALDGSPFPKMPWGTKVQVTVGGKTFTPDAGVIDLGPGKQASKPGEPHALDLTPGAAAILCPNQSPRFLANNFEVRGSFRILGGAQFAKTVSA
jgi:hypothetical protein